MERLLTAGLVLVCFGQNFVCAKTEIKYFVVTKSLELRPPPGVSNSNNIIWRHKDSLVAEWAKGDTTVMTYGSFKDRATLNTTTGHLVISGMTENDAGEYSVEINDTLLDDRYMATAIQEVPKPKVWVRPAGQDYVLWCEGNVDNAGPVTYWWDTGEDGAWVELGQKVLIVKNETMQRLTFSCKMKNPVSEKDSEPISNPWRKEEATRNLVLRVLLVPIAGIIGLGIAAWCYKDTLRTRWAAHYGGGQAPEKNVAVSPQNEAEVPLKGGSGGWMQCNVLDAHMPLVASTEVAYT